MSFHYISIHGMINIRIFTNGGNNLSEQQKTRITVDIYGQQYSIVGTESSSHIRLVASIVDDKMREISAKNPTLDVTKLAVLTAVNVVHEYIKLKEEYDRLLQQMKKEKDE
jgi:cell division protein ZapA